MRFAAWPFLLLLLLLVPAWRRWLSANKPPLLKYSVAVPKDIIRKDPQIFLLALKMAAVAALIVALARPQASYRDSIRSSLGIDIMLVMDVSASMNAIDMDEQDRFTVAKATIESFIKGRSEDRIGLILFSGEPITAAPLTLDYDLVLKAVSSAASGILKDGTGIGDGLALAVTRLKDSLAKSKVVVLLTDGDNNVGQVDPATAGDLAAGFGIKAYTIAIGKEGRVKIPIKTKSLFGADTVTYAVQDNALNTELLQHISKVTGGNFYRVQDPKTLDQVFKEIDSLERNKVEINEKVRYEERFYWPLSLAVLLLFLEKLLRGLVYRGAS